MEMMFSAIPAGLLIFSLVIVLINVLLGCRRGLLRALIRAVMLFVSIVISVLIAKLIASAAGSASIDIAKTTLASSGMDVSMLDAGSGNINGVLAALITVIVAPMIFLGLHWIVTLLTKLADKPLKLLLESLPFPEGGLSKGLGALVGVLCGVLVLASLLSPITGFLCIAEQATSIALPAEEENPLTDICNAPAVKLNRALGGKWLFNSLTTTRYKGERVRLADEVGTVAALYDCAMDMTNKPAADWSDTEAARLQEAAVTFEDSVLIADLAATMVADACDAWSHGQTYMDMPKPQLSEVVDPTLDVLYEALADSTTVTFRQNVHTLADIACTMIEHDVIETIADASTGEANETVAYLSVATNKDFTDDVIDALYRDEQLRVLIPEVVNLSLRAVAYSMDLPSDKDDMYNRILQDTADALASGIGQADVERMVALGDDLYDILTGYGVDISPAAAAGMAAGMVADFAADSEINPDDLAAWFAEYAAAAAKEKADQVTQSIAPTLIPLGADDSAPTLMLPSGSKRTFAGAKAAAKYVVQQNTRANAYQILTIEHDGAAVYRFVSMSGGSILVYDADGVQLSISPSIAGNFTVADNGEFTSIVCQKGWTILEQPRRVTAEELSSLLNDTLSPLPEGYVPVVDVTENTAVTSSKLQNAQNKSLTVTDIESLIVALNAAANHEVAQGKLNDAGASSLASAEQLQSSLPCRTDMLMQDVASIAQNMSAEDAQTVSTALNSVASLLASSTETQGTGELVDKLLSEAGSGAVGAIMDSMTALSGSDEHAKNTLIAGASVIGADVVALKQALDQGNTSPSAVVGDLLSSAGTLMALTDESLTTEQRVERITAMLADLSEGGARSIAAAISPSMLIDMGLPTEIANTYSSLISSMFLTLADAKASGMSEEQFDREADALSSMFKLATSVASGEHNATHLFGADGLLGCEADTLLDTVTGSNIISSAMISMIGGSNGAYFTVSNPNPLSISGLGEADEAAILDAIERAERSLSSYPLSNGTLWSPTSNTVTRQDMARRLFAFASVFGVEYTSDAVHVQ